jgi:hypothetical protein
MTTSDRVQQALDRVEDRTHATANGTAQVDAAVLAEEVKRLRDAFKDGRLLHLNPHAMQVIQDAGFVIGSGSIKQWILGRLAALEEVQTDRDEARATAEELRLTLLAEQGNAEGAPDGWAYDRRYRAWRKAGGFQTRRIGASWAWQISKPVGRSLRGRAPTARAAMQAAGRTLFESRRAACVNRVQQIQSQNVILWPPNGAHQQTPAIMLDRLTDPDLTEAVLAIYEALL